jgi:hypothetical protein
MKKNLFGLVFIFITVFAQAQLRKIPADVTDAFSSRYPHAKKVEWRDRLQYFEATFQLNGSSICASFSSNGEWEGSERVMEFNDLPEDVRDGFLKSKYADWKKSAISEAMELGKPLQYKISVQRSGIQKKCLHFDANGRLLKENISL